MRDKFVIKKSTFFSFIVLIAVITLLSTVFLKGIVLSFSVCLVIFLIITWRAAIDVENNIVLLFFCISIFAFLIAAPFADLILGYEGTTFFKDSARNHFYYSLGLSLFGVLIGYVFFSDLFTTKYKNRQTSPMIREKLMRISRRFFIVTYAIKMLQYIEIAFNTVTHGYIYYYTDYSSFIPFILIKVADVYIVGLAIYLACMPERREGKRILLLYIIGSSIIGLAGRRFDFVIALIVAFAYCLIRNRFSNDGEQWITKKMLAVIAALIPVFILLLMILGASRSLNEYGFISLRQTILEFMADVGNSGKVVMRAYENKELIPSGRFYSFGSIIEYFQYNEISQLILGSSEVNARTADYAMNGHSLAYLVTYLFSQASFFSGHGQGSCYIAELFADFGYVGVFIGSCILGVFIKNFGKFNGKSVFHDALCIFLLPAIIHMPRDTYCLPLTYIINLKYLAAFAFIFLLAYNKNNRDTGLNR